MRSTEKGTVRAGFTDAEWQDLRLACELAAGFYHGDLRKHFEKECDFGGERHERMDLLARKVDACWSECFWVRDGQELEVTFTEED